MYVLEYIFLNMVFVFHHISHMACVHVATHNPSTCTTCTYIHDIHTSCKFITTGLHCVYIIIFLHVPVQCTVLVLGPGSITRLTSIIINFLCSKGVAVYCTCMMFF